MTGSLADGFAAGAAEGGAGVTGFARPAVGVVCMLVAGRGAGDMEGAAIGPAGGLVAGIGAEAAGSAAPGGMAAGGGGFEGARTIGGGVGDGATGTPAG